ncbi:hypothetical protein N183_36345 [Sinorhizobium sp. Sb3]|nr:hypothetical protein N183_36345 [Sinorhizobium sp. Sb3]
MAAFFFKDLDDQIGSSIDDGRMPLKVGGRVDEPSKLDTRKDSL